MKSAQQLALEAITEATGALVQASLPNTKPGEPTIGYALFLFDHGPNGFMAYTSNSVREDMIKAIREWLEHIDPVRPLPKHRV